MSDKLLFKMVTWKKTSGALCESGAQAAMRGAGSFISDAVYYGVMGSAGSVGGSNKADKTAGKVQGAKSTLIWRQTNDLSEPSIEGFEKVQLPKEAEGIFVGLCKARAAPPSLRAVTAAPIRHDLRNGASSTRARAEGPLRTPDQAPEHAKQTTSKMGVYTAADEDGDLLYSLGNPEMNRFGGMNTFADKSTATAQRIELYVLNPR